MGLEPTTPCLQSTPSRTWPCVAISRSAGHKGYGGRSRTAGYVAGRDSLATPLAPLNRSNGWDSGVALVTASAASDSASNRALRGDGIR
jgi:hypothetical protein